jgi:hypothetical protein
MISGLYTGVVGGTTTDEVVADAGRIGAKVFEYFGVLSLKIKLRRVTNEPEQPWYKQKTKPPPHGKVARTTKKRKRKPKKWHQLKLNGLCSNHGCN